MIPSDIAWLAVCAEGVDVAQRQTFVFSFETKETGAEV
jgi:hypothetical protein